MDFNLQMPLENSSQLFLKPCQQPATVPLPDRLHINILIPSMVLGGAERIVHDVLNSLAQTEVTANLILLWDREPMYPLNNLKNVQIIRLQGLRRFDKLRTITLEVLRSPSPVIYTHLILTRELAYLWNAGILTIPVIHNSKEGWLEPPHHYNHQQVPFIITCCDTVTQQIQETECTKPVITIRHELYSKGNTVNFFRNRSYIREKYNISDSTFLIGMVGQFKPQKAYSRAIEILFELQKYLPSKLMIIGGWDTERNREEYIKVCQKAKNMGVLDDLVLPGNIYPIEAFYSAFDIYLNTSNYEGLSMATLEAKQHGCPIVASDVGGQKEIFIDTIGLVKNPSDINSYIEEIRKAVYLPPKTVISNLRNRKLIPKLWCLLSKYGTLKFPPMKGILFVTNNLNPGGAQRSLTRLLCDSRFTNKAFVCILGEIFDTYNYFCLNTADIQVWTLYPEMDLLKRIELFLSLISKLKIKTICFWNVDPKFKLLVSKILFGTSLKIVDVSPGSMYFEELETTFDFQKRIAWNANQYFERLSKFIIKYQDGLPIKYFEQLKQKTKIIPNGVPVTSSVQSLAASDIPTHFNPDFMIGTCCRIAPVKRIEWLINVLYILNKKIPDATLTIVGGVHPKQNNYWETLAQKIYELGIENIYFPGQVGNVFPYLRKFKVFIMVSEPGGCPNASLEAMVAGLPIVATRFGGALDQIEHEVNGYLVSSYDPQDMAERVEYLLRNPQRLKEMGQEAFRKVSQDFSINSMVSKYIDIFNEV